MNYVNQPENLLASWLNSMGSPTLELALSPNGTNLAGIVDFLPLFVACLEPLYSLLLFGSSFNTEPPTIAMKTITTTRAIMEEKQNTCIEGRGHNINR